MATKPLRLEELLLTDGEHEPGAAVAARQLAVGYGEGG